MNTTFTTCAEKKAKQFLNLLQGYTKGIRMTAILILLLMGVSNAWAYVISAGSHIYLVNTGNWSGCQLYIWKSDGYNTSYAFDKITNTNIYHFHFASSWNGYEGVKFRSDNNWSDESSGDIKKNLSSCYFVGSGTTNYTTLANMNRAAKVVSMVSTGGNYTEQANSACIATVSGHNLAANASSTTKVNASTGSAGNVSINAAYGSTITYTATAGTGYTFKGFSTSNSTSLPSSPSASGKTATASAYGSSNNTTYYAYFKANQYTVKFDANGGSGTMSNQSYAYGVSQALTTNAFTRTGYTFAGWNTKADGTGTSYTDKQSVSNLSSTDGATITLYAQWTANTYTITLGKQGGTGGTTSVTVQYKNNNYSANPVTVPSREGYIFNGYYSGTSCTGVQVVDGSGKWVKGATGYTDANGNWINTSAGTLYACWTIVEETKYDVTISADANGSVNPSGTQQVGASGIQVTATPNDGYEFKQWSNTGGAEAVPSNSATTTVTATANGTITASFVAKTYTITLGKQGGTGGTTSVTVTYNDDNYSVSPVTVPSREGYIFNGYYSGTSCSGSQVVDESGEWVKGAKNYTDADGNWINTSDDGTPLYACWTEKSHDVTIRYLSGTTSIKEQTIESGVGEAKAKSISAPDITGYVFTSWTLGDGITNKSANTTTNPISITTKAEGTYMLTANYQKAECVYFINTGRWTKVQIYAWLSSNDQDKNADWPGVAMEKLNETINGYEVYRYIRPAGKNYDKLIFNNKTGDSGEQTSDLDWEDGKYYVYSVGQWVEREHVEDYLPNPVIYFKNHLGWENVYVYFFTSDNWNYGAITQGLTEANGRVCKMEKVGDTDIYKYDYSGSNFAPGNVIAFTKDLQPNYDKLHNTEAAYRSDYNPSMELYIPQKDVSSTDNGTKYHNKGLWMRYNSQESGYSITGGFNNWNHNDDKFITGTPGSYQFTAEMALSAGETYNFKLKNIKNDWYSTGTSITANKAIEFITEHDGDAQIKTETDGNYVFTVDLSEGKLMLTVKYAVEIGDYRIIYKDNADDNWSGHDKPVKAKWYHPSRIIKKNNTDEATKDFVSFFINKDQSPELILQRCSAITNGSPTWADDQDIEIPREITESTESGGGVYNFVLNQTEKGETKTVEYAGPYTGNYYIRCNAMDGKWNKYKTNSDNRMFYSAFSESDANSFGDKYSHYATKYCTSGTDIKFTIANDYSDCISDTLVTDIKITGNQVTKNPFGNTNNGVLTGGDDYNANIRFMWNRKTNKISRAYVGAASESNFLVLQGNKDFDDTNNKKSITFSDTQNWIYEINVKVHPDTRAKLYACYPRSKQVSEAQYFRGVYDTKANENWDNDNSAILLGGSGSESYDMRVLYDFKTNRLMAALVPSGNIEGEVTIDADVMIMREHQKDATCITLANDKSSLNNVKTVYGAMKFNRTTINNRDNNGNELNDKKSIYERALYFISFPFDVHLSDVFGFGTYGTHWVISEYNGLRRAQKGYFIETCYTEDCTNWDYIWRPDTFTMKANTGYLLSLDLDLMQYDNMDFWKYGITYVELFFPSEVQLQTIQQTNYTMPALGDKYECKINFNKVGPGEDGYNPDNDHRVRDSYWRCIGVPSFANYNGQLYNEDIDPGHKYPIEWQPESNEFPFLYQWNTDDNSLQVQNTSNFNFRATFAYLVQNGNSIYWSAVNAKPSNIVARKQEAKRNYDWKITIARNGEVEDQTFVRLTDHEKVTTEFDFNQDLSKEFNYGRSDIYTLIGYEKAAANSLPFSEQTTLIPLGLSIEYNGDYTIAMPGRMENIGVILIDTESNTRTNLSAGMEYTLTLNKGDYNNRFFIEISPIQQTPTDIEYVTGDSNSQDSVRKVLIDNILYIVRDGQIFDARGARVK